MIHEATYKHWNEHHTGVWRRRWAITETTLRAILGTRMMKPLITSCWMVAFSVVCVLFLGAQVMVEDSIIYQWMGFMGSQAKANPNSFISMLLRALRDQPEIFVRAAYCIIFYYFTWALSHVSVVLCAMAMPHLLTRDIASNAITIYSSKAINRMDYFIGKFGAIFLLMTLTWLGPVLAAWVMGNLLAPDWSFFWYSKLALIKSCIYVVSNMLLFALIVLGISAVSGKEKTTIGLFLAWYVIGGLFVGVARETKPWLKYFSFKFDLHQISLSIFHLREEFERARDSIPLLSEFIRNMDRDWGKDWYTAELTGALIALGIIITIMVVVLFRKVRAE